MPAAKSRAETVWEGDLAHGHGTVTPGSGAFGTQEVTWASRTTRSQGKTSPEELIAAAQASCYAMALSHTLGQRGTPPTRLDVSAEASFEPGKGITQMDISVRARVPGMDQQTFQQVAQQAEQGCPVSSAIRNNVPISLKATLEG